MCFRHELKTFVVVPPPRDAAPPEADTPADTIARHEAMLAGHRAVVRADVSAIDHCERAIAQARRQR